MNRLIVRDYRDADCEAAIALWKRAWDAAFPDIDFAARMAWWRERWTQELVPNNTIRMAKRDGQIVGFLVIDPRSGYLDQLVVAPELWGTDVANALIAEAKHLAPAGIVLHVNKENPRAIRFYEREGFERVGEENEVNPFSGRPIWRYAWKPR